MVEFTPSGVMPQAKGALNVSVTNRGPPAADFAQSPEDT